MQVIKDVVHQEQVQTNPYHVSAFTLRLLYTLGTMIEDLPAVAARLDLPVLLLHGGRDIFSHPEDVAAFEDAFPARAPVDRRYFPESFHLLLYDHEREKVLRATADWLRQFSVC